MGVKAEFRVWLLETLVPAGDQALRHIVAVADDPRVYAYGAGGMATVYVAEDLKHHLKVAIRVLHAELSAILGPERFIKAIELTANTSTRTSFHYSIAALRTACCST